LSLLVVLATRLAWSSIKGGLIRSILIVISFTVGTALILLAASIPSATRTRSEREHAMIPRTIGEDADRPTSYSLIMPLPGDFLGREMRLDAIAGVGEDPPSPPGLERVPPPGRVAISPALAELLESPSGALLAPRVPGRVTEIITKEGLPAPDALVGYVGRRPSTLPSLEVVIDYGLKPTRGKQPISLGVWTAVVVLLLAILAPVATVLGAATRLSSRTREARLAALRLAGATPLLIRTSASIEAGCLALAGASIGVPSFLYGRTLVAQLFPDPFRWFPEDLLVGGPWIIVVLLVVITFAIAVAIFSLRRVQLTPLQVVRQSALSRERPVGVWFTAAGIVVLILAPFLALLSLRDLTMISVALGLASTVTGLILAVPWLVRRVARRLALRAGRPALLLGMASVSRDPGNLGRTAAAVAIIVLLGAIGQALVLASAPGDEHRALKQAEREPNVVFVSVYQPKERIRGAIERVDGVRSIDERPTDLWGGIGPYRYFAVRTDGSRETEERVKNALAFETPILTVDSARSLRQRYLGPWNSLRGIVEGMVGIALLVIWVSVMVATVDRTFEQRRSMAGLSAIGARTRVLRASVAAQAVAPLVLSVGLGWILSVPVTTALFSAVGARLILPTRFTLWLAVVLSGLMMATTALAIPWVRGVTSPSALRSE
jgi:hypothetical protein